MASQARISLRVPPFKRIKSKSILRRHLDRTTTRYAPRCEAADRRTADFYSCLRVLDLRYYIIIPIEPMESTQQLISKYPILISINGGSIRMVQNHI